MGEIRSRCSAPCRRQVKDRRGFFEGNGHIKKHKDFLREIGCEFEKPKQVKHDGCRRSRSATRKDQ